MRFSTLLIIIISVGFMVLASLLFIGMNNDKVLVLAPELTARAYAPNGFYDYFNGECDESCLSIPIYGTAEYNYRSSSNALIMLGQNGYGYDVLSDMTLVWSPEVVNNYDTLIVLHNEYVTQGMFEAITNHPNVFYLYPNALYGLVEVEMNDNTNAKLNLISGHGVNDKDNAFDWEHENTRPDEFDNECLTAQWLKVSNGWQLNCYPENAIQDMDWILDFIEERKD